MKATVVEAGGGEVRLLVDRNTMVYPSAGELVELGPVSREVAFTVPRDEDVPPVGTPVSVPVGGDWFEIGVITSGSLRDDGRVTLFLRLDERLELA
jgi:hypothetical protein